MASSFYCYVHVVMTKLCWVFISLQRLSKLRWARTALCRGVRAAHCGGFSCCGAQALGLAGSIAVAPRPNCSAAWGISRTRDPTSVPCIDRRILSYCATREVQDKFFIVGLMSQSVSPVWGLFGTYCQTAFQENFSILHSHQQCSWAVVFYTFDCVIVPK